MAKVCRGHGPHHHFWALCHRLPGPPGGRQAHGVVYGDVPAAARSLRTCTQNVPAEHRRLLRSPRHRTARLVPLDYPSRLEASTSCSGASRQAARESRPSSGLIVKELPVASAAWLFAPVVSLGRCPMLSPWPVHPQGRMRGWYGSDEEGGCSLGRWRNGARAGDRTARRLGPGGKLPSNNAAKRSFIPSPLVQGVRLGLLGKRRIWLD